MSTSPNFFDSMRRPAAATNGNGKSNGHVADDVPLTGPAAANGNASRFGFSDLSPTLSPAQQGEPGVHHAGESPNFQAPLDSEAESPSSGVHAITKKTDYWFERHADDIERKADKMATDWAMKGLPRHDVERTEPLEPEQVLGLLSSQVLRQWQDRVRTRMQDAVEEESQRVSEQVGEMRSGITRLETINAESTDLRTRIDRYRDEAARDTHPVRYSNLIPGILFWPAAIVLALVEFFANFPVFRLMLPMSSALAGAAQQLTARVDTESWFAGPLMLLREMLMHFEATVVALVAVIVLVLLGKTLGGSIRPLMVFHEDEHPLAAQTIRAHRRQHTTLGIASALGVGFVLSFLFLSRRDIAQTAADRVSSDSATLAAAVADQRTITDKGKLAASMRRVAAIQKTLQQHEDDAAYARTVQRNNMPILYLNLGLVLCAIVLGFSYKSEDLSDKQGAHPAIAPLQARLSAGERESWETVAATRTAAGNAHAGISRVHHLLNARALAGWQAKVRRLESVIPRFRGENSRLRGLDPANIRAFDERPLLDVPAIDEQATCRTPEEFARLQQEFEELRAAFARIAPRMAPATAEPVAA